LDRRNNYDDPILYLPMPPQNLPGQSDVENSQ
jgi:hypothetical protein